jgi:hypothetical protein
MEDFGKQIQLAYQEHYYLILAIRIGAGILSGLILLLLGIKKQKRNLAILAFVVSLIIGTIAPILLIIDIPIFIWLILRKPKTEEFAETENLSETPASVD